VKGASRGETNEAKSNLCGRSIGLYIHSQTAIIYTFPKLPNREVQQKRGVEGASRKSSNEHCRGREYLQVRERRIQTVHSL
jgi:hypothetical protein